MERRRGQRHPAELDVDWETPSARGAGAISDISESGCFILCGEKVIDGEAARVFLPIDEGMRVEFTGRVAGFTPDVGFAVAFSETSPGQRDLIAKIVRDNAE